MTKINGKIALENKMKELLTYLNYSLAKISLYKASPSLLHEIQVETLNKKAKLREISNIIIVNSQTLHIKVWNKKYIDNVYNAVVSSKFKAAVQKSLDIVKVVFPIVTNEYKKQLLQMVQKCKEKAKVTIRLIRQDTMKMLQISKKNKLLSSDEYFRSIKELQSSVEKYSKLMEIKIKDKINSIT